MPRKTKKSSDTEEYKRFLETAKKVEADERKESFERAFNNVVKPSGRRSRPSAKRDET